MQPAVIVRYSKEKDIINKDQKKDSFVLSLLLSLTILNTDNHLTILTTTFSGLQIKQLKVFGRIGLMSEWADLFFQSEKV